jgi:hypothetical protein
LSAILINRPGRYVTQDEIHLPDSVRALMAYTDDVASNDYAEFVVEVLLAGTHPDCMVSIAAAAFLPPRVRSVVADFVRDVLVDGLGHAQRRAVHAWALNWWMARFDR